jgi:hypothetical protein
MADALAAPRADQSAKAELSQAELLLLLDGVVAEEKSVSTAPEGEPLQPPSVTPVPRELSLDEILQKVQRDIAEGKRATD